MRLSWGVEEIPSDGHLGSDARMFWGVSMTISEMQTMTTDSKELINIVVGIMQTYGAALGAFVNHEPPFPGTGTRALETLKLIIKHRHKPNILEAIDSLVLLKSSGSHGSAGEDP